MSESDSVLFSVDINNYNGPLDVLLDLAKAQKVDLEEISITKLADQFHDYITKEKDLNLEIASEYLLMATWLAYLKSKLLLPGTPEEEFKVQEVAEKLKLQLKKLELIRLLSEQMLKRNRLGREIRIRGIKGNISGFKVAKIKQPNGGVQEQGVIRLKVCVDASGNVIPSSIKYSPDRDPNTSTDLRLRQRAIDAMKQFKFTNTSGSSGGCGYFSFTFKLQ